MRRFLRSPKEYAFRFHQETQNVRLWAFPPKWRRNVTIPSPLPFLPPPAAIAGRLRGTKFAAEVIAAADALLQHRFPILGITVDSGPEIRWRRDPLSGIETGLQYFRRIPYLNARLAGDHKRIWELNRHQHLLLLAQAWLLTEHRPYLKETLAQLDSWMHANPMQRGINWTSALEVAFRGLSWLWLYHLIAGHLPAVFLDRLYQHGRHLAVNLSIYFSPNTHLLGEAVALHALGLMFGVQSWERTGAGVTEQQLRRQVRDDGSHFEQSTYYHLYALDMFLFHAILRSDAPPWYRDRLAKMADYLHTLAGPDRSLPFIGDDDGGRFFHPFGRHAGFARATLATCRALHLCGGEVEAEDLYPQAAWWIGEKALDLPPAGPATAPASRLFPDAGIAVMRGRANRFIVDAGAFGPGPAGHSHSDTLSIVASAGAGEILIDPGTYCYVDDPKWRNWFRGSSAHNTIRIDGKDQATPVNPFRWADTPVVRLLEWISGETEDTLEAECSYAGFAHRRKIRLIKPGLLLIVDVISGPEGEHTLEQFWHPGETVHRLGPASFYIGDSHLLVLDSEADLQQGGEHGWRAPVFGQRIPAPVVRLERRCALPARFMAALYLDAPPQTEIVFHPGTAKFSVSRLGDFQLD